MLSQTTEKLSLTPSFLYLQTHSITTKHNYIQTTTFKMQIIHFTWYTSHNGKRVRCFVFCQDKVKLHIASSFPHLLTNTCRYKCSLHVDSQHQYRRCPTPTNQTLTTDTNQSETYVSRLLHVERIEARQRRSW